MHTFLKKVYPFFGHFFKISVHRSSFFDFRPEIQNESASKWCKSLAKFSVHRTHLQAPDPEIQKVICTKAFFAKKWGWGALYFKKGSTGGQNLTFFRQFSALRAENASKNPEFKNKFDRVRLVFGEIKGF